ncbi:tetratricopeptide repeat protein [Sphingomonas naphthae]|uniref:Tetratricopeptide repeat protein n=1 Tax=Sphingomonas naphthae TaxID=1813468 RepID=A0ABY7TJF8_9SPHN|nr:tetratricopeptide repeat protein [Sphingomonas naphthae]WCT72024.1 tetratricopeptide repeat protein [Sphingomonas naphthae]
MRSILAFAALVAAPLTAAAAQDQVAFRAITKADYTAAETQLAAQVAAGQREPGVLLNLAAVYNKTGRAAEAVALYRMVQSEQNVLMETASGAPIWSHDVATRGMTLASR